MQSLDLSLIKQLYSSASRRVLFLGLEGTLMEDRPRAESLLAEKLQELLLKVCRDPLNHVVVLSKRRIEDFPGVFKQVPVTLVAERGGVSKESMGDWIPFFAAPLWNHNLLKAIDTLKSQYHGSRIVKGQFTISWDHRKVRPLSGADMRQIQVTIRLLARMYSLEVHQEPGEIEFSAPGLSKGRFAGKWVSDHGPYDFILALGNDWCDEALFEVIGSHYITVRVGYSEESGAKYFIEGQQGVEPFLAELTEHIDR